MSILEKSTVKILPYSTFEELGVSIRNMTNTIFCTKIFDNLVIGPYIKNEFIGCPRCVITTLNQYHEENLLTVVTNNDNSLFEKPNEQDLTVINAIISDELNLNYFENYLQVFNLTNGKSHNYKVIENEYCPSCSNLIQDTKYIDVDPVMNRKTRKLKRNEYRTNEIENLSSLFDKWNDYESGIFIHKYDDFRSSYVNAVGVEVKADSQFTVTGYGRSLTESESYNIALLEAVERYCGLSNRKTMTNLFGSYNQLKDDYNLVDPEKFVLGVGDSKYLDYTPDLEFYWVKGYSMINKREVFVPEQLAYYCDPEKISLNRFNYSNRFVYDSSNGLALGSNRSEAILHGILEVVERDAFLNLWYSNGVPSKIDISNVKTKLDLIFQELEERKIYIHFFKANRDLPIPCVVALIENRNPSAKMKYYLAASSNFDSTKAIENSAFEVITSLPIFEELLSKNEEVKNRYEKIKNKPEFVEFQDDHILFNSNENSDGIYQKWILDSQLQTPQKLFGDNEFINETIEEDLSLLVDKLAGTFEEIVVINETPGKIEKEGFFAYKSILPGTQPMYFGVQNRRISNKRISAYTGGEVQCIKNEAPHPFP